MLIFDDVPPGTRRLQYERQTQGRMLVPNPETTQEAAEANDRVIPLSRYRYGPRIVMAGDTATVHVTGPLDSYWGLEAARLGEVLDTLDFQRIVLQVATPGGYVEEAARIYADMTARKDKGIRVDSVAAGFVASAGIPLFAVGETRTALPGAGFMAHAPYVLAFAAMGRRSVAKFARQIETMLAAEEDRIEGMLVLGGISQRQAQEWHDGDDHWMTATEAHEAGLLTVPAVEPTETEEQEPQEAEPSEAQQPEQRQEEPLTDAQVEYLAAFRASRPQPTEEQA